MVSTSQKGSSPTADPTETETDTPPPTDHQAPSILLYESEPLDNGQRLAVRMKGEDDRELEYAGIMYGDRVLEEVPEGRRVDMEGILEDIPDAEPVFPGMVAYVLRDAAGNETEKVAYADETAPVLSVGAETTRNAGELEMMMEGEDEVGLHELRAALNGEAVLTQDATGQKQVSSQKALSSDSYDSVSLGEMNTFEAELEDAMGNTTRKLGEQYVRKYDKMEDTRLRFGAQYQPFFKEFEKFEMEGRVPSIGQYETPYPMEVFDKHLDQMSGFGVNMVRVGINDSKEGTDTVEALKRYLKADLVDQVEIAPHYGVAGHLWLEDSDFTADNYREDLVEPHMNFIRETYFTRENSATYNGRPIMDIWNPEVWLWEYPRGRIEDEWGDIETFIGDIRSHLRIDGKDPFLVGGFNDWPLDGGYSTTGGQKLAKQFDAVSTWVAGGAWGEDNFATQEEVLDYVERNWEGHLDFVNEHDMDLIPVVFPGFNEVKEPGRRTPRSPEFFYSLMELADKYRTTDMIWTPPYNNWEEATHYEPGIFEPGPFGEENYGTAYLEKVEKFQRDDTG